MCTRKFYFPYLTWQSSAGERCPRIIAGGEPDKLADDKNMRLNAI